MSKFKVGDRVVVTTKYGFATKGLTGTIIPTTLWGLERSNFVLVSFDNWNKGHNGDGRDTTTEVRSMYFVEASCLNLLSTEPETSMEGIEEI